MGKFVKGAVVVVPFPFSDLSQSKRRPALVLTDWGGEDLILCQITSKAGKDRFALALRPEDFQEGSLHQESNIRPNKLFTADESIILYQVGKVKSTLMAKVTDTICNTLRQ
ncbi:type II toxin-antitoxin system PemK/MazF family toxin [soil metagenome]